MTVVEETVLFDRGTLLNQPVFPVIAITTLFTTTSTYNVRNHRLVCDATTVTTLQYVSKKRDKSTAERRGSTLFGTVNSSSLQVTV